MYPKRVNRQVSEEELKKIQDLDWDNYFRKHYSEESQQLWTCPKCGVILVRLDGQEELTCYSCGEKIPL